MLPESIIPVFGGGFIYKEVMEYSDPGITAAVPADSLWSEQRPTVCMRHAPHGPELQAC